MAEIRQHLAGIGTLLLLVQLGVNGKNHVGIGVTHPALQRLQLHLCVVGTGAEFHAEVVTADGDVFPGRQLSFRKELLLLLALAIPSLARAVQFRLQERNVRIVLPRKGRLGHDTAVLLGTYETMPPLQCLFQRRK